MAADHERPSQHGATRGPIARGVRKTLKFIGYALGAVVAVYLVLALRVATLKPVMSFDSMAAYRELLPTSDDPAWPVYLEGLAWTRPNQPLGETEFAFTDDSQRREFLADLDRLIGDEPDPESTDAESSPRPDVRAVLAARETQLATLRRAASMPVLGREPNTSPDEASPEERAYYGTPDPTEDAATEAAADTPTPDMLLEVLLPQLAELRLAARLLAGEARVAEARGDLALASEDFLAMFGIARHAEESRTLIGQLVAAAIRTIACREIVAMLERESGEWPATDLERLAAAVASVPETSLRIDMVTERLMFEDVVQRTYSDDGSGDGLFIPWAFAQFTPLVDVTAGANDDGFEPIALAVGPLAYLAPSRRETLEQYQRWLDALELDGARPWWDQRRSLAEIEREIMPDRSIGLFSGGNLLLALLLPAVSRANDNLAAQRFELDAAAIAIALARFRDVHSAWPDSLDQLVPELLADVPCDPETALPYRYELRADGPLAWSVGPDGFDDGASPFRRVRIGAAEPDTEAMLLRTPPHGDRTPSLRTGILLFHEREGRWPESLEELSPELRAGVPRRMTEHATYRLVDGIPVLERAPTEHDPLLERVPKGEAAPGDRILVDWGLGTFADQPPATTAS